MTLSPLIFVAEETPAPQQAAPGLFNDPFMLILLAVAAVLIFFMWRNSRKRKAMAEELGQKMVPGAEVMTNFGLFGTLVSVDETANTAELQISPGVFVNVHRQTLAKVVEPGVEGEPRSVEEAMEIANREQAERDGLSSTDAEPPQFGERVDDATPADDASSSDDTSSDDTKPSSDTK